MATTNKKATPAPDGVGVASGSGPDTTAPATTATDTAAADASGTTLPGTDDAPATGEAAAVGAGSGEATPPTLPPDLQPALQLPPPPDCASTDRARNGYARYSEAVGGVNFQGNPLPTFDELPAKIQWAWVAALDTLPVITLNRLSDLDPESFAEQAVAQVVAQAEAKQAAQALADAAAEAFDSNPELTEVFQTADGQCFEHESDANNHAQTLTDKGYHLVTRPE